MLLVSGGARQLLFQLNGFFEFLTHVTTESSFYQKACRFLFTQVLNLTDQFNAIKHPFIETYVAYNMHLGTDVCVLSLFSAK